MDYIHTRVDRPIEIRRDILEAAVDISEILKSYDKIKSLNESKRIFVAQLQAAFKGVAKELGLFVKGLPGLPQEFLGGKADWTKMSSVDGKKKKLESEIEEIRTRLDKIKTVKKK